ncbi:hypothetical protein [Terasakiella pusilla]|uniref:hypothetical protein n=1 Tax=Terasakiella pusilla TaxID=64973 RepID=UPI003AA8CCE0
MVDHKWLLFDDGSEAAAERAQIFEKNPADWNKEDLYRLAAGGRDVWNMAMEMWPGERVDFTGLRFDHGFDGYIFKKGVDFAHATLREVSFVGTVFGDSDGVGDGSSVMVRFNHAKFHGPANFEHIKVYDADFHFSHLDVLGLKRFYFRVSNDNSDVASSVAYLSIHDVEFKETQVLISNVVGANCNISLNRLKIHNTTSFTVVNEIPEDQVGGTSIQVTNCVFEESSCAIRGGYKNLLFIGNRGNLILCEFSQIKLKFGFFHVSGNRFESGALSLMGLRIAAKRVTFCNNNLCEGVSILDSDFKLENTKEEEFDNEIQFYDNTVGGKRFFIKKCEFFGHVDFSGSVFDSAFGFDEVTFDILPDMRLTKVGSHFSSEGMRVLRDDFEGDKNLSDKYRRFKELAIAARDHDRELEYFAKEMRAKMQSESSFWKKFAISLYGKTSDFGCSIEKPLHGLVRTILFTGIVLFFMAPYSDCLSDGDRFLNVLKLTLQNIVPFLPISKLGFKDAYETLFPDGHFGADIVLGIEGLLGFIFLFLIGLALRNRFRL